MCGVLLQYKDKQKQYKHNFLLSIYTSGFMNLYYFHCQKIKDFFFSQTVKNDLPSLC